MVFYYSRGKKTKIFAEALGEVRGMEVHELKSDLNEKGRVAFMFKALSLAFSGKTYPVLNMPAKLAGEIFLCGPVWGGQLVGPPRYFLHNADLRDCTVNLLLTASVPVEKYRLDALEYLNSVACKPGDAYIFAATGKVPPQPESIKEQMREIMNLV